MSVVGLRSYESKWATVLDEKLGRLVSQLEAEGEGHGSRQARLGLALELDPLAELLDPLAENARIDATQALRIPVPILRRLRHSELDGRGFQEGLREAIMHLRDTAQPLEERDLGLLRHLVSATSEEASEAFDRVVRR
jgi:hypothetical protein